MKGRDEDQRHSGKAARVAGDDIDMRGTQPPEVTIGRDTPEQPPDLSILILNWNGAADTSALLHDLERQATDDSIEILVLDNASDDRPPAHWLTSPLVRLIQAEQNLGYSGGMRKLIEESRGRRCWLLNNDCRLLPGALETAIRLTRTLPRTVMIFPLVLNPDGSIQSRDCSWHPALGWHTGELARADSDAYTIYGDLFVAPIIERQAALDLHLFPVRFHTYGEDFDACYALAASGHESVRFPQLSLTHRMSSSKPRDPDRQFKFHAMGVRNALVSVAVNYEWTSRVWAFPILFFKLWLHELLWRQRAQWKQRPIALRHWVTIPYQTLRLYLALSWLRRHRARHRVKSDASVWAIQ